jgi:glycolate oxidase
VLIIEVDGLDAGLDRESESISAIVAEHGGSVGKSITWRTRKEPEYVAIWKSRKSAFGAIGRLSPTYCTQDGVVPRTKLPHILRHINQVGQRYNLRVANVFHAGDGNIHPILLFDERDADQVKRVLLASHEILDECIRVGGSVTGEHGIGVEKMEFMPKLFAPEDLAAMVALRDTFNPESRCNPSKMLPGGAGCIERTRPGHRAPA